MHDFFVARVWCGVCVWCVWLRVALAWSRPCASVCAAWSAAWTVCRVPCGGGAALVFGPG